MERTRVFELLASLNIEYEQVRIHLLAREANPTLSKVYTHLHREERHCSAMLQAPRIEQFVLVSSSQGGRRSGSGGGKGKGRTNFLSNDHDKLKCEQSSHFFHTKENSWDLYGKPPPLREGMGGLCGSFHGGFRGGKGGLPN